jgi:hypothetical protein
MEFLCQSGKRRDRSRISASVSESIGGAYAEMKKWDQCVRYRGMSKYPLTYAPPDNRTRRARRFGIFSAATPLLVMAMYFTDLAPPRFSNLLFAFGFAISFVAFVAGMISVSLNNRCAWGWVGVILGMLISGLQALVVFIFVFHPNLLPD